MKSEFLFHKGDNAHNLLQTIREYVNKYPNGVSVTVEPYCLPRTREQNALLHVLLRRLSEQSGFPMDALKDWIKDIAVGHGYPVERDEFGNPISRNGSYIPISSANANIAQMKMLIDACYELGLRYDIVLDDIKG